MLETVVFGRWAGQRASEYVETIEAQEPSESFFRDEQDRIRGLMENRGTERAWQLRDELGELMSQHLGIFRMKNSLLQTQEKLRILQRRAKGIFLHDRGHVFNTELIQALELGFLLDVAEIIVVGALAREESRGAHYRKDAPSRDDKNWLKHTIAHKTSSGPVLTYTPVTIMRFPLP